MLLCSLISHKCGECSSKFISPDIMLKAQWRKFPNLYFIRIARYHYCDMWGLFNRVHQCSFKCLLKKPGLIPKFLLWQAPISTLSSLSIIFCFLRFLSSRTADLTFSSFLPWNTQQCLSFFFPFGKSVNSPFRS